MATKPNKNIKVSQKTIDEIKKMGMTKALKEIKNLANQGQGTGAAGRAMRQEGMKLATSSEFAEGVRRMYGDRRSAAARTQVSPTTSRGPAAAKMAKKIAAPAKKASTSYSPAPMKTPAKKSSGGGISKTTAATVAGTVAAAGLLLATRGRGASLATKLAPGLMKNKTAQALLLGKVAPKVATKASTAAMKVKDAAAAASGRVAAKAGKPVSQAQYDAMVAAAKARGVSTAASKAAAKKATTTAAKKAAAPKKTGLSAGRRFDANAPKAKAPKKTK